MLLQIVLNYLVFTFEDLLRTAEQTKVAFFVAWVDIACLSCAWGEEVR